eukprot:TRINITY_DN573_c0_g1_i2.p1 TRINITY_DN573_c0_g1~~TRINITY_DN573_c0_g1_i2.p1  ORF type:complete len:794 (-),score=232.61 TRINITY_DN573_c0_g1_i2:411-2492(-)
MIMALSMLDLPFLSAKHEVSPNRITFSFKAKSPVIMFHKETKETEVSTSNVSVIQNYFDPADATEIKNDEAADKYVTGEFLCHRVYGARIVLTNVSSQAQEVELLLQIPAGSIPISRTGRVGNSTGRCAAFITKTEFVSIQSYGTYVLEYFFYFPTIGQYRHYPVHVSKNAKILGYGQESVLKVVSQLKVEEDLTSWNYLSSYGTDKQVLDYLEAENLFKAGVYLEQIAWRCRLSVKFYEATMKILLRRMIYNQELMSFSVYYRDETVLPIFLNSSDIIRGLVGPYLRCSLVDLDTSNYIFNRYQHFEYAPLLNDRAHRLQLGGGDNEELKVAEIQNEAFKQQYDRFIHFLIYRAVKREAIPSYLLMSAVYYLLLQERTDEAVMLFGWVKPEELQSQSKNEKEAEELQLHYDYMCAYLDFFNTNTAATSTSATSTSTSRALRIAKKYQNYPVLKKRKLFQEIVDQIVEASPEQQTVRQKVELGQEQTSRDKEMSNLSVTEPTLSFTIESKKIAIQYNNMSSCVINYYIMDLEILFTMNPFLNETKEQKIYVSPNYSEVVKLPEKKAQQTVDLPKQFHNKNIFVEVVAEDHGLSSVQTYYSHSLNVQLIESYGQVKVTHRDTGLPIPKAYVKVFARVRDSSTPEFYKDGYTDMRGRFDYVSLSTNKLEKTEKFSILVLSEDLGALVLNAKKPAM